MNVFCMGYATEKKDLFALKSPKFNQLCTIGFKRVGLINRILGEKLILLHYPKILRSSTQNCSVAARNVAILRHSKKSPLSIKSKYFLYSFS